MKKQGKDVSDMDDQEPDLYIEKTIEQNKEFEEKMHEKAQRAFTYKKLV